MRSHAARVSDLYFSRQRRSTGNHRDGTTSQFYTMISPSNDLIPSNGSSGLTRVITPKSRYHRRITVRHHLYFRKMRSFQLTQVRIYIVEWLSYIPSDQRYGRGTFMITGTFVDPMVARYKISGAHQPLHPAYYLLDAFRP